MKKALFVSLPTLLVVGFFALPVIADERLVAFQGGIGVVPVSSAAGVQNADGTFPNVNRNVVRGVNPGGQPWVIADLRADVRVDGRIAVDGRGLLLAGGNNTGRPPAGLSVRARLFCSAIASSSRLGRYAPRR